MTAWKALVLGLIQGLTEFLPISSSGHLVLGKYLLNLTESGIEFEVIVHFGTLLAVLTVFFHDIITLIKTFFSIFTKQFRNKGIKYQYYRNSDFRLLVYIILATIPAGIVGLLFEEKIEAFFVNPRMTCFMLIITAIILFLTFFVKNPKRKLNLSNTFAMGIAQAVAIMPGISRSGSTISTGLYFKLNGDDAARFSFLLALPAILGATILEASDLISSSISSDYFLSLAVGLIASYVSGYCAIELLLKVIKKGKLYWFSPYCLILGIIGLTFI